jgi:1,4-dihydroxy-2-naphthoate octaprenyltransferase
MMSKLKYILGPMRVPFLILAPACVLLGLGTAVWTHGGVSPLHFVLALVGAIAAHISVNSFNEYFDFKSGLDSKTQRTPFSGGSGTLQEKPELSRQALATAIVSLVIVSLVGVYFLWVRGPRLLPLGLVGVLLLVIYTPWLAHDSVLCLIAPGLGFGYLMVVGTHFVLTGEYSGTAFVASLVPFFLVSNLLLLNQFPDVEADRSVGRSNFPIAIGRRASSLIYGAFLLLAFVSIVVGVLLHYLPKASLLGLLALAAAIPAAVGAYRFADDIKKLVPYMGLNVLVNIATPVLVAIGLFVG